MLTDCVPGPALAVRARWATIGLALAGVTLSVAACGTTSDSGDSHPAASAKTGTTTTTAAETTTVPPTLQVTTIPVPAPIVTTTTNPEVAVLQSEISQEQAVVDEDTSNLQGAEGELESDMQWCNDPLEGGFTGEIGYLPCSTQLQDDEGTVSQDTQELSYAQATLATEQQELLLRRMDRAPDALRMVMRFGSGRAVARTP